MKSAYWLTTLDGSISHQVPAASLEEAFDALARAHTYPNFEAFCADLGYAARAFQVSFLVDKRTEHPDPTGLFEQQAQAQQRKGLLLGAFKALRRVTAR